MFMSVYWHGMTEHIFQEKEYTVAVWPIMLRNSKAALHYILLSEDYNRKWCYI